MKDAVAAVAWEFSHIEDHDWNIEIYPKLQTVLISYLFNLKLQCYEERFIWIVARNSFII